MHAASSHALYCGCKGPYYRPRHMSLKILVLFEGGLWLAASNLQMCYITATLPMELSAAYFHF